MPISSPTNSDAEDLVAINDALDQFGAQDAYATELVKLRYFSGLSIEESGQVLRLPRSTVYSTESFERAALRVLLEIDSDTHES